jgi:putative transposase
MPYNRYNHRKNSSRLQGWDYSRPGAYFVTINVKGHVCFFGEVKKDGVVLSDVGEVARKNLIAIPEHFPYVFLDSFEVMPNHMHIIIFIERPAESFGKGETIERDFVIARKGVQLNALTDNTNTQKKTTKPEEFYYTITPKTGSLSIIMRTYKASVKTWCNNSGYGDFIWQRGFNDRVIRSNEELKRIRKYIIDNPKNWDDDENNPLNVKRI